MADSEEEDYMSDAFLAKCQDPRPGLVAASVAKKYAREKTHVKKSVESRTKPRKVLEEEKRSEGLSQAIGADNKGFAMLQKMGYQPGMGLGKKAGGRKEPVPINLHSGREGLGKDSERKRKKQEMDVMRAAMAQKRRRNEVTQKADYRSMQIKAMSERRTEGDLRNSQRVCETLDMDRGLTQPIEAYFWTPTTLKQLQKKRDSDEDELDDLASDPHYCFTEQDSGSSEEDEGVNDDEVPEALPASQQLELLTAHLRTTYLYCVWCGTRFEDKEDLGTNCPGDNADAHEDL